MGVWKGQCGEHRVAVQRDAQIKCVLLMCCCLLTHCCVCSFWPCMLSAHALLLCAHELQVLL